MLRVLFKAMDQEGPWHYILSCVIANSMLWIKVVLNGKSNVEENVL